MAGTELADDASSGTDTEEMEEQPDEPPCRQAERYIVPCPLCHRKMRIKTLKYSHVCGRSFDPIQRALEQKKSADIAAKARMEQLAAQIVSQKKCS